VRSLFDGLKRGDAASLKCWCELANVLLHATVADDTEFVTLSWMSGRDKIAAMLMGYGDRPIRLRNGNYLRVWQSLFVENTSDGPRLKVLASVYQYARDEAQRDWLFRYDYARIPPNHYPGAHLQVRGTPPAADWLTGNSLDRIHFPTHRVSLEAVPRLLIEDFGVPAAKPEPYWRAVLATSEDEFRKIAHPPSPGPTS